MKKTASTIIFLVSLPCSILGIILLKTASRPPEGYEDQRGLLILSGIIIFSLGIFLWTLSKRIKSISVEERLKKDARPPVLFLRSFKDDSKLLKRQQGNVIQYMNLLGSVMPQSLNTEEEQMAIVLNNIGPAICIGRPGDVLAPPGFDRQYVPDPEWMPKVMEYIERSQLILIRASDTEGLIWEIRYLWNHPEKRKKVIFLLPEKNATAQSFNSLLTEITGKPVPVYKVEWLTENFAGLLYFDQESNPVVVPIKNQFFRFGNLISVRLKKTLESLPANLIHFKKLTNAGKKERLYAFLLDVLMILGIVCIPCIIVYYLRGYQDAASTFFLGAVILYLVYSFIIDMTVQGRTFGKRKMHLKMMDKEQIEPTFQQVVVRNFFKLFNVPFFSIEIIVFLLTGNHLHDYVSGTRIFKVN
jgi:uncharacterized RDD family membrane protein YckC